MNAKSHQYAEDFLKKNMLKKMCANQIVAILKADTTTVSYPIDQKKKSYHILSYFIQSIFRNISEMKRSLKQK